MDKIQQVAEYYFNEGGENKSATARHFGISSRTVGRYLDKYNEHTVLEEIDDLESKVEKNDNQQYFIPEDATHKSLVDDHMYKYHKKIDGVWYWWDHDDGEWTTDYDYNYSVDINDFIERGMVVEIAKPKSEQFDNFYVYQTTTSIQLIAVGSSGTKTISVHEGDTRYDEAKQILDEQGPTPEALKQAFEVASKEAQVRKALESVQIKNITIDPEEGSVVYTFGSDSYHFKGPLVTRLIEQANEGQDLTNLTSFAEKVLENPSTAAVEELYGFLEANDVEIDESGNVIAWKKVRDDYKDIYTGTIDNSPGQIIKMPRHLVNDNRNETCSSGLHICSKSYLPHFGYNSGNKVVKVSIHPKDFVSIPVDYQNAKARVCEYQVLEDVTDIFNQS